MYAAGKPADDISKSMHVCTNVCTYGNLGHLWAHSYRQTGPLDARHDAFEQSSAKCENVGQLEAVSESQCDRPAKWARISTVLNEVAGRRMVKWEKASGRRLFNPRHGLRRKVVGCW